MNLSLITLGDELLLGLTENKHLTYLGEQLSAYGAAPSMNLVIPDEAVGMKAHFLKAWESSDIVITTGGLGPTSDDRTREIMAEALGLKLIYSEAVEEDIRQKFIAFGKVMTDNNKKQAYYPEGFELLMNAQGTAPGLWYENAGKTLIMLPGPPRELHPMFENQVIPKLIEGGKIHKANTIISFQTAGEGESSLEDLLVPILNPHTDINVAFCAHYGTVDVRLNSISGNTAVSEIQELAETCREALSTNFLGYGKPGLPGIVIELLRKRGETVSVAESCTGGLIGSAFTDIAGSSDVFNGGIITYTNAAKAKLLKVSETDLETYGAVSETVCNAMAQNVTQQLDSTWGISTTGIAGPSGGTPEKPVGTVFLGIHGPSGTTVKHLNVTGSRGMVRERTVNHAFDLLRRQLL